MYWIGRAENHDLLTRAIVLNQQVVFSFPQSELLESDVEVWQYGIPLAFLADALNRLHSEFRKAIYGPYRIHVKRGVF